ncbi:hypothetical protein RJ639_046793, partial [Escallonia herrerae]
ELEEGGSVTWFTESCERNFYTMVLTEIFDFKGCLLTLAVSVHGLRPPPCMDANKKNCRNATRLELGVFFSALYILAVGTGGTKPNISTIGADQFDVFNPKEKAQKLSFFNWWMFSIVLGVLFAGTVLVYIQDNVGWALGYGIPTAGLAISISIFLAGTPFYRHKKSTGSPFTRMARVIVAGDPKEFHELHLEEYTKKGKFNIESTTTLSTPHWPYDYCIAVAKKHGVVKNGGQVPTSIFILLPQFVLRGLADSSAEIAKIEFFYDQAPESMKSLGTSYSMTSTGIGNFLSTFILSTVSRVTKEDGHGGWVQNNLNASRLDYYLLFLAVLSFANFLFYLVVTRFYHYKAEVSDSREVLKEMLEGSQNKVRT